MASVGKVSSKVHYQYIKGNPMRRHGITHTPSGKYRTVTTKSGKPSLAHKVGHLLKGQAYKSEGETYYSRLLNFAQRFGVLPQSRFEK